MYYKFETIMTWMMYIKTNIWKIDKENKYAKDPELVKSKYEELFLNELVREYNDCTHTIYGLYQQISTITLFVNTEKKVLTAADNYNTLMAFYNGIYSSFEGKKLCLNIKKHGMNKSYDPNQGYFQFREKENEEFVFVESIVSGTCTVSSSNIRRLISVLFARTFEYLISSNPEDLMFIDYSPEEKEQMIKDCDQYDKRINKKKATKKKYGEE